MKQKNNINIVFLGILEGIVSIILNILLFVFKLIIGLKINSLALISDAIHTLSDSFSSIVLIIGTYQSHKPADIKHPYGHKRIEYITTITIAILLIVTGIEVIRSAVKSLITPEKIEFSTLAIVIVIISIVIKYLSFIFAKYLAKKSNSKSILADAIHHLTDSLSSIIVLISLYLTKYIFPQIDGIAGIIVSLFIIYSGIKIFKDASSELIGDIPSDQLLNDIKKLVFKFKEIKGCHDIQIHKYGTEIFLSIHIEINESMNLIKAHEISDNLEHLLQDKMDIVSTIHIDPLNINNPKILKIKNELKQIIKRLDQNQLFGFHDIRIIGRHKVKNIVFDLTYRPKISFTKAKDAEKEVKYKLSQLFKGYGIIINLEKQYM